MARGTDITQFRRAYSNRNDGDFPEVLDIVLAKEADLKYGENPNQNSAIYSIDSICCNDAFEIPEFTRLRSVRSDAKGKGGLSLTNTMDVARAMEVLKYFSEPAVVIMKHTTVSGFAKQTVGQTQADLFRLARDADRQSNFGGTVVFNSALERETAEALYELRGADPFFVDVLAAPEYNDGVLGHVETSSSNIRIGAFSNLERLPKFQGDETYGLVSLKEMPTGRIGVQTIYLTSIRTVEDLILDPMVIDKNEGRHIVGRDPNERELDDLLTSWWLNCSGVRSNGIVFMKNGVSVAIGSGQVERVGAIQQGIIKGIQKAMDREKITYDPLRGIDGYFRLEKQPFEDAVCSSDGFFPFRDAVDSLARFGVSAVIQPFGSLRDAEVIDAANEHKMAMVATGERCFIH